MRAAEDRKGRRMGKEEDATHVPLLIVVHVEPDLPVDGVVIQIYSVLGSPPA